MLLNQNNEAEIRDLLIGRTVKKVDGETLMLDNGLILEIKGNWGCGGCSAGNYDITELNDCPNMIMNVEFDVADTSPDDAEYYDDCETTYRIFVYAENQKIKLLEVEGTDGNGYYGTGYWIEVVSE